MSKKWKWIKEDDDIVGLQETGDSDKSHTVFESNCFAGEGDVYSWITFLDDDAKKQILAVPLMIDFIIDVRNWAKDGAKENDEAKMHLFHQADDFLKRIGVE